MENDLSILAIHEDLVKTSPEYARILRFAILSFHDPYTFSIDEYERTILHYAASMHAATLKHCLAANIYDVNWADCLGQTALHAALSQFSPSDAPDQFLQHGADPNYSPSGPTPLMLAVLKEDVDMVRTLLKAGADPNQRHDRDGVLFKRGDTALSMAMRLNAMCQRTAFTRSQLTILGVLIQSAILTPNTLFHALQQTKHPVLKKYMMECASLPKI